MAARKIVDYDEVFQWMEEGRSYQWMAERYREKYDIAINPKSFAQVRYRYGLPKRVARDADLVPWAIQEEHRGDRNLAALRDIGRLRSGLPVPTASRQRAARELERVLRQDNLVLDYNPLIPGGFYFARRQPADKDIVRVPTSPKARTKRRGDALDRQRQARGEA